MGSESSYNLEVRYGIGEEDFITLALPYVSAACEDVACLDDLSERYGAYESNGIGISDVNDIWWIETVGNHYWIAKRVPCDCYATIPNQFGIDNFNLDVPSASSEIIWTSVWTLAERAGLSFLVLSSARIPIRIIFAIPHVMVPTALSYSLAELRDAEDTPHTPTSDDT